jgi:hypothetical protein
MHRPRILTDLLNLAFLALAFPSLVQGTKTRKDMCGLSMHTRDFPDRGNFSAVEATFTVPQVAYDPAYDPAVTGRQQDNASYYPYVNSCVALCCGDDCSTRLSAGVQAFSTLPGVNQGGQVVFQSHPCSARKRYRNRKDMSNSVRGNHY